MNKLVGRHAISAANDRNNFGTLLFGHPDAPLIDLGREQSHEMGQVFRTEYGIVPSDTQVAVSKMLRSQETALGAGFIIANLTQYEMLNEVDTGLDHATLRQWINEKRHTKIALKAAELILENPPEEPVYITHGLVIASLGEVLGISHQFESFIPKFCEIRELPI